MKKIIYRFAIVLTALAVGILLVASLSYVGNESSGPVEDFLSKVKSVVANLEEDYILKKRVTSRSAELLWLKPLQENAEKMKNPEKLLLGAFDNQATTTLQPIIVFEDSLDTVFPLIHIYSAWGSKREQRFPKDEVESIVMLGSIPMITWEPWLNDFTEEDIPGLPDIEERDKNGLKSISSGLYDSYLKKWAKDAKAEKVTILIRLGHEMNDPYRYPWGPQNNEPQDFIDAWKHVVELFRKEQVINVLWVWAPHLAYGKFRDFYPGDEYVDWIATGTLNYGTVAPWSQWWTFDEIFAKYYEELATYHKPIMLAEFGSLAVGGDRAKWYAEALYDFPTKYPAVKALIFFHNRKDATTTFQTLNWYIKDEPAVVKAIKEQFLKWPVN